MRLSDLRDAKVRTLDGDVLRRVHEVHCEDGRIVALTCGPGSFIESLTARKHGRRIPWDYVRKVKDGEVVVAPDPPQRKSPAKKPSDSRNRQRTRQANARPSKR